MDKNGKRKRTFVPKKIPRFLPGSVHQSVIKSDLKTYNEHLYKVFTAKPRVDDLPPKFHCAKYLAIPNMEKETRALKLIQKDNKKLLEKINYINRTHGYVDSFNKYANNTSSKWFLKEKQIKQINKENKIIFKKILNSKAMYSKKEHDEHWNYMLAKMRRFSKFPLVVFDKKTKDQLLRECPSISKISKAPNEIKRPLCFLEFKINNGIVIGTIIIELYTDQVPKTAESFLKLIRKNKKTPMKNCDIFKIFIGKYCLGGDATNFSIDEHGESWAPENFNLQHTRPGVLSMVPKDNKMTSQFCLTFDEVPEFDSKYVVIGKVVKGAQYLFKVAEFGTKHGKPITKIVISNCGQYSR